MKKVFYYLPESAYDEIELSYLVLSLFLALSFVFLGTIDGSLILIITLTYITVLISTEDDEDDEDELDLRIADIRELLVASAFRDRTVIENQVSMLNHLKVLLDESVPMINVATLNLSITLHKLYNEENISRLINNGFNVFLANILLAEIDVLEEINLSFINELKI